ncbi:MAG: hypothetical protein J0L76_18580 [Rhodobacterales bacterium]|nr:hypothetical protein [Rhodobacterales bacterium]
MTLIVLGLALWWGAHLWKRVAPGSRARWGEPGKGLVTVLVLVGVVLMVLGFRGSDWLGIAPAEFVELWSPPRFLVHVNNLLMFFAVYLFAASGMKTRITRVIRHPQLTAVKTWAVAHLLVNGDLASVILFGGILAWAVVTVILINRAGPRGPLPEPAPMGREIGAVLGAVVVLVGIMLVHNWLGVPPWG